MLSEKYSFLLDKLLIDFSEEIRKENDVDLLKKKYALFVPQIGLNYHKNKSLLVIGQAVNGWEPAWNIDELKKDRENYLLQSIEFAIEDKGKCSIEWVNDNWTAMHYPMYRSFFWNVTYKLVMKKYNLTETNWNNVIAYSNLMKISAAEGGNPNYAEQNAQLKYSAKLLKQEIEELQPKNVLIITNLKTWAAPVLGTANISYQCVAGEFLQGRGNYKGSNILITRRPFVGNHGRFVDEIAKELV